MKLIKTIFIFGIFHDLVKKSVKRLSLLCLLYSNQAGFDLLVFKYSQIKNVNQFVVSSCSLIFFFFFFEKYFGFFFEYLFCYFRKSTFDRRFPRGCRLRHHRRRHHRQHHPRHPMLERKLHC